MSTMTETDALRVNLAVRPKCIGRGRCPDCRVDLWSRASDAQLVCPQCRSTCGESLAFGEAPESSEHLDVRCQHFHKFLAQFRIGVAPVPDHVIAEVGRHFHKTHDRSVRTIKPNQVREALRTIKPQVQTSEGAMNVARQ
jgi:hypothetical protein